MDQGQLKVAIRGSGSLLSLACMLLLLIAGFLHAEQAVSHGGATLTRAGWPEIHNLEGLRGKTVGAISTDSLGGHRMQAFERVHTGFRDYRDFRLLASAMPHDRIVDAVLSGRADIGSARSVVLENTFRGGTLHAATIKIVNRQDSFGFPVRVSSRLYAGWAISALAHTEGELKRRLASLVLALEDNMAYAQALRTKGFNLPSDDSAVEGARRDPGMPPVDAAATFTAADAWVRYRWPIVGGAAASILILLLGFRLFLANRSLDAGRIAQQQADALKDSESYFRAIIDASPVPYALTDDIQNISYLNPAFVRTFGYSREDIPTLEQWWPKAYPDPAYRQSVATTWMSRVEKAKVENAPFEPLEVRIHCKDGSVRTVLAAAASLGASLERVHLVTLYDITQNKRVTERLETVLEAASDGVCILDQNGNVVEFSHSFSRMLGYTAEEAARLNVVDWDTQFPRENLVASVQSHIEQPGTFETKHRRQDGSVFDAEINAKGIVLDGRAYLYASSRDISARKQAEMELRESNQRFRTLFDSSSDPVWIIDGDRFVDCNRAAVAALQYSDKEMLLNVHPSDISPQFQPDGEESYSKAGRMIAIANEKGSHRFEWVHTRADGSNFFAEVTLTAIVLKNQHVIHCLWRDISERKYTEVKLRLAASVFSHAREGIMITKTDGEIIDVNDSFHRITGYARDEVLGKNPRILNSGRHNSEYFATMWRKLIDHGHWQGEIWNRSKKGDEFAVIQTVSTVRDAQGNASQYIALFSDITALKEHERQLEHIAHHDALTALPNRVLLADRLHQAMAQTKRHKLRLAVAYLDLDGFKAINDNHGHAVGDQLLITVAGRMKRALRDSDTVARLGGDEFIAVITDLTTVEASALMLTRLLSVSAQPVHVGDLVVQVSASIGVAFFPQAGDVDADQLLRQADHAMYQAKLAGKNQYQIFDAEQDRSVRGHHGRIEHIQQALTRREFVLHYQPKVNMRSGKVVGAEALIRWQHPSRGLLPPADFLPAIENHAMAIDLGEWVIDAALTQLELWHAAGFEIPVSVNIGARQLQQAGFVDRLRALLATHPQVRPDCLELEVLETSALADIAQVSRVMYACREIGVKFSLDDFGTGYSSLTYLRRLPVTQLKIDKSFVCGMLDDPDDLAIIDGILSLATAFRRQVVAEGVETAEHAELLLQLGCEWAQGYGIARPMPADELRGWSMRWRPDPAWADLQAIRREDLPLLFGNAEHRAWFVAIEACLKGERDAPPPLDRHQCRLGAWLDAAALTRSGALPVFRGIDALHQHVHALAIELCELQAQGRNLEGLARLGELHGLRDALLEQLKTLVRETRQ